MNTLFSAEILQEGLILPFDKPYKWTSFDLVNFVRKNLCLYSGLKRLKVGHAGTLDPLATGLLILCVGKATRDIDSIQELTKEYEAEITFGATTPSFDRETEIDSTYKIDHITDLLLTEKLKLFKGKIKQIPPLFSAKKISGTRAYEFAREGINKRMGPVDIEIYDIEMLSYKKPILQVRLQCSKGTYIRSLASDLGKKLNSGAYLTNLKRTAIGPYKIGDAMNIKKFQKKINIL